MKEISLKNQRLENILSRTTDKVYKDEIINALSGRAKHRKCTLIPDAHPASEEYFNEAVKHKLEDFGFPRAIRGVGTGEFNAKESRYFFDLMHKDITKIKTYLGALDNALCMFYPKDGFIGWHHNGNAPGYNILFSYSTDGQGSFSYYDYESKSINKIQDKPGWNVKVGYYPSQKKEPQRVYWHAAETVNPRLSIAFIINNRDMWSNMIETITKDEFDRSIVDTQGPLSDLK